MTATVSELSVTDAPPTRASGSGGAALSIDRVTKVFGRGDTSTVALREVTLDVRPHEFVTVVGASRVSKYAD